MKNLSTLFFLFLFIKFGFPQEPVILIFDEPCNDSLPVHFRKSNGEFQIKSEILPDTTGLASLNASGSAEFCLQSLQVMLKNIAHKKITVVDLRQECHGFVNGLCISWFGQYDWSNVGLSFSEVENLEGHLLDSLRSLKTISVMQRLSKNRESGEITDTKPILLDVKSVLSEYELTKQNDLGYFRITVTDHRKPTLQDVDRFIEFVNQLDENVWLHFHCHAGDGRTTTFLAMYDMMRNAKKVSAEDIFRRQYLLGGIDLTKNDYPEHYQIYAKERIEFLYKFYNYCKTNTDNFKTLFSVWVEK